jgi:hypothetical protein
MFCTQRTLGSTSGTRDCRTCAYPPASSNQAFVTPSDRKLLASRTPTRSLQHSCQAFKSIHQNNSICTPYTSELDLCVKYLCTAYLGQHERHA